MHLVSYSQLSPMFHQPDISSFGVGGYELVAFSLLPHSSIEVWCLAEEELITCASCFLCGPYHSKQMKLKFAALTLASLRPFIKSAFFVIYLFANIISLI